MNKNLNKLFNKIINDSEFIKNIDKNKNLKYFYEYCLSYVKGYTIEEFKEFLKSIIIISDKNSGKATRISDEKASYITGGINSNVHKNKFLSALISGLLLTSCGYETLTNASPNKPQIDSTSINENLDFNSDLSKIVNNLSDNAKQNLQIVSKVAENCLEGAFDFIAPKASAADEEQDQKIKPTIKSWPMADQLEYGQKVCDSKLTGGSSDIPGHFEWDSSISQFSPTPGGGRYKMVFKPDDTKKYEEVSEYISLFVFKARVKILSQPKATSINYGQPLESSEISGLSANVDGRIKWGNSYFKFNASNNTLSKETPNNYNQNTTNVSAGNHTFNTVFIPYNPNYEEVTIPITVCVNKITPKLEISEDGQNRIYKDYTPDLCLNDIYLPNGWHWENPYVRLESPGEFNFIAVYYEDENHYERKEKVTVTVNKIFPAVPKEIVSNVKYEGKKNLSFKLKDVKLPEGWNWEDPEQEVRFYLSYCNNKLIYNEHIYNQSNFTPNFKAYFNASECKSKIYKNISNSNINIKVNLEKASPKIYSYPIAEDIIYGQKLWESKLSGLRANVEGSLMWDVGSKLPDAGLHTFNAVFIPNDSFYEKVTIPVEVNVKKIQFKPFNETHFSKDYAPNLRLSDFSLPCGWHWENPDTKLDKIGTFKFWAIHDEDSNNSQTKQSVSITISKAKTA